MRNICLRRRFDPIEDQIGGAVERQFYLASEVLRNTFLLLRALPGAKFFFSADSTLVLLK